MIQASCRSNGWAENYKAIQDLSLTTLKILGKDFLKRKHDDLNDRFFYITSPVLFFTGKPYVPSSARFFHLQFTFLWWGHYTFILWPKLRLERRFLDFSPGPTGPSMCLLLYRIMGVLGFVINVSERKFESVNKLYWNNPVSVNLGPNTNQICQKAKFGTFVVRHYCILFSYDQCHFLFKFFFWS